VTHWPHVGSDYRGLVVVGQAVFGWPDDCQAIQLQSPASRAQLIQSIRGRAERPEPLDWIATHPVRNSPFWKVARGVAEALEPAPTPWFSRIAWVNLYPSAPEDPRGNPGGALKEAQDPHVGSLLRAVCGALDAKRVIAVVGPYWRLAATSVGLEDLPEEPRPLYGAGVTEGRTWVVGWHPNGASHRHVGADAYTQVIVDAVRRAELTVGA